MRSALLLDTNLLILHIVGRVEPRLIHSHKRLRAYDQQAHAILVNLFNGFDILLTTPNILTETSNLLGQGDDPIVRRYLAMFRSLIDTATEIAVPSREAAALPAFDWLGLADAVTIAALRERSVLLTDDQPLYHAAWKAGRQAELFSAHR